MPDRDRRHDVLIFEPDSDGHQREWLQHLVRYAERGVCGGATLWFLVSADMRGVLFGEGGIGDNRQVRILALRPFELRLCTARILAISGFARWWVMRRHARRIGAAAGVFLAIDHLSLPLALGLGIGGSRIIGVLFRPSVHYSNLGPYAPTVSERMRDLRKAILYRLMLLNHDLHALLSLDPYFTPFAETHYRRGDKVHTAADPAFPVAPRKHVTPAWVATLPRRRTHFVLFGYLTARKGVLTLLDALALLPACVARNVTVTLAGRIAPEIGETIAKRCSSLLALQSDLALHVEDRWLGGDEIAALVDCADVLLAPYQRFVGSSGVLMWAAQAGKPVLAQNFGLIGRLVRDYRLGATADVERADRLAAAMARMTNEGPNRFGDRRSMRGFVEQRSPEQFASLIFAHAFETKTQQLP